MSCFVHHNLSDPLPADLREGVVAIGNFDGVHLGHQQVLSQALDLAEQQGRCCLALSFEPHPRTLFKPDSPVFRLTPQTEKARVLEAFGLDGLVTLDFTHETAGTPAETFISELLLDRLGITHVVTGFNFHFGKGREGSPDYLKDAGIRHGFGVTIVEALEESGEPVSSSRVRRLLGAGQADAAAIQLGYRWNISGHVTRGAQIGRTLGFPTANLVLPESCHLAHGIYAVRLRRADGTLHDGVASYGRRPTFDNGPAWFETYLFDFDDDLYDEPVSVGLFDWVRSEQKFDSGDALIAQMHQDAGQARSTLGVAIPLSELDQKLNFGSG